MPLKNEFVGKAYRGGTEALRCWVTENINLNLLAYDEGSVLKPPLTGVVFQKQEGDELAQERSDCVWR